MKSIITDYTFNKTTKTITFANRFNIKNLLAILNVTSQEIIYAIGIPGKGYASYTNTTLVLEMDTSNMNNTDILSIHYEDTTPTTASGALLVGNAVKKFRFGGVNDGSFTDGVDPSEFVVTRHTNDLMNNGGNAYGSSYLRMVKSIYGQDTESSILSTESYKMPFRFGFKPSLSQRLVGQEISIELVGVDEDGNIENSTTVSDLEISGTITIASNVATINFATAHNLRGGTRVLLYGNTEKRLNVGPVYVTVVNSTQITVPCTLANGTYIAGGYVKIACPFNYARNATGELFENTTATNALFYTKRNGCSPRPISAVPTQTTITTTAGVQSNTNPYTDAWNSGQETEFICGLEETKISDRVLDANNANNKRAEFNQTLPDEEYEYKIRVRCKNNKNFTVPVANITAIEKTGTTTATVTTDVAHGLVSGDYVQIYGVRDITNFPNLTASTVIASVVDTTHFTIVIGTASTNSSYGGVVAINHGSVLLGGAINFSVQSIVRTNNILTATLNTTVSGVLPGEMWTLAGMVNGAESYNGMYKVLRMTGSTIEFESIGNDFVSINCGGAIIKNTELRLHGLLMMDYTREIVELMNARGDSDVTNSLPTQVVNTVGVSGTLSGITSANLGIPLTVADQASGAITTTTTSSAITPASGVSYIVNIPVTAVSGATPTMDIKVQESHDAGTNWGDVYHFPRITATGNYVSPVLKLTGNRVRYVQTITGTSPSFTRAINRLQANIPTPAFRQMIDRTIVLTTLNSVTPSMIFRGCSRGQILVDVGTMGTAPVLIAQCSNDGDNWADIGEQFTPEANKVNVYDFGLLSTVITQFVRIKVATAGATIVFNNITIIGIE